MMPQNAKFQRNFIFSATSKRFTNPLVLGSPFTIEFHIKRDTYAKANKANIRLYNLSQQHRNLLLHDNYDHSVSTAINIVLQAGYGVQNQYPILFKGVTSRAFSYREGVNFITELECYDGGLAYTDAVTGKNSPSGGAFAAGTSISSIIQTLISKDLLPYGVSLGAVSQTVGTLARSVSFSGNTIDLLVELSNSNLFIDNITAHVLHPGDAIGGTNVVLNAQSGLLGTPIKENYLVYANMLLEPRLIIGSIVTLDSITAVNTYNGLHKVVGIEHQGMISPAVSGTATTKVTLQAGNFTELSSAGIV